MSAPEVATSAPLTADEARVPRLDRGERAEVVLELRAAGLSTRAIGSAVGIGDATVRRDLATASDDAVAPETVVGLDGAMRSARRSTGAVVTRRDLDDKGYAALVAVDIETVRPDDRLYLVESVLAAWAVDRVGPGALVDVWRRLTPTQRTRIGRVLPDRIARHPLVDPAVGMTLA